MSTQTIERYGITLTIPDGCQIIEREKLYGMPINNYCILYWPTANIVEIIYGSQNVWYRTEKSTFGDDGYVYDIKFNLSK